MIQSSTHSLENLRNSLILESDFEKVAMQFLAIATKKAFTDQCQLITKPKLRHTVISWLRGLDLIATGTPHWDTGIKHPKPSLREAARSLQIQVLKKRRHSDLCHGWGFHQQCFILFFLFTHDTMGLVIRTNLESGKTDFLRLAAPY